jgi:acetyltransferase-like isoleucine patch superfamily enzyme
LKGIKIGKGAIIGAGSIVTKNIEPFTVNAGSPSRMLRRLDEK